MYIGDPHLKITRFDLAKQFLAWIDGVIIKHKPDLVVNLGDTFDTHAVVRSEIMTEFIRHVESVNKTCPYIYLLGNHDMYKPNDNKYHALKHLKGKMKEFTIIDELINLLVTEVILFEKIKIDLTDKTMLAFQEQYKPILDKNLEEISALKVQNFLNN